MGTGTAWVNITSPVKVGYLRDCPTCHAPTRKYYLWLDVVRDDCCSDECWAMYLLTKETE